MLRSIAVATIVVGATMAASACSADTFPDRVDSTCSVDKSDRKAYVAGSTLCINGYIDEEMLADVGAIDLTAIKKAVLRSPGGDVYAALMIAQRFASLEKLSVVVSDYCVSSCANYLFISGTTRVVLPGAILGFHGAPPRTFAAFEAEFTGRIQQFVDQYNQTHSEKRTLQDGLKRGWENTSVLLADQAELFGLKSVSLDLLYDFAGKATRIADQYPKTDQPLMLLWVPRASALSTYGVQIESYPVDDASVLQQVASRSGYSPVLFN